MASHPGFRLPPIGELGLRAKTSQRENVRQLEKGHDDVDDIREQAVRSEQLDLRSQKKRIAAENSNDERSDKVALIKRNDLISRDSGLEIESPSESKEKLEHIIDVVVKTKNKVSKRKGGKRSPRKKVRSNSPAVIPFANEINQDVNSSELIPQHHHVIMPAKTEDTELPAAELKVTEPISNGIDLEEPISRNLDKAPERTDYRELAIKLANDYSRPKMVKRKRTFVDYVLVFDNDDESEFNEKQRDIFEKALSDEHIDVSRTPIGNHTYVELCCSFERLCEEAETIFLEMPLLGLSLHHNDTPSKSRWKAFQSEREVDDICIPFCDATKEIFDGVNERDRFFRPALRSLLVHQILKTLKLNESEGMEQHNVEALANLLHSDVYTDAFILHERSSLDPRFPWSPFRRKSCEYPCESATKEEEDRRKDLHMTWLASFKFQPLWKIRNYFGEKIALYFAWLGMLITSLWVPMCIGIVVFIYGFTLSFVRNKSSTWSRVAFDNDLTPAFALLICLWGTVFLEVWKRKNAELAYKWDVDDFEEQEPNRPQFYGTEMQLNPISGLYEPFYSPLKKTLKTMSSMSLIFFMVVLVLGSLVSVIIYRIISRVDWFTGKYSTLKSNLTSSILNSTSIMLLGFLYKLMAKKLTEWENHRTQTQFEDSLILKLFGFQFVNSYSSLYYIAFFRERTKEGILGRGSRYTDACGASNDCMSLLSLQVGTLMLMKPMPKLFTDIVIPLLQKAGRSCLRKCQRNKILDDGSFVNENLDSDIEFEDYVEHERKKPPVGDFTLSEYTEKVIQYGYLMLFAAAFPLAPLIALLTNLIDMRIDARRLLWLNRRPIPARAQDIGMWLTILNLLNYIGVITNGFIIAITSSFGRKYQQQTVYNVIVGSTTSVNGTSSIVTTTKYVDTLQNLWIIIVFQNITFVVKFILEYSIPDEPEKVRLARKKERYQIENVLKRAGYRRGRGKSIVPAVSRMSPRNEEPINVENTTRIRKESMREKIRKLSQERKKARKKLQDIEENPKKLRKEKRQYFVNEQGDRGSNVEESEA